MISVCTVTRARPEAYKRLNLSALENADNPTDIEFVTHRDADDETVYEYTGNCLELVGDNIWYADMWNKCQQMAKGDIYLLISDDFRIETQSWDTVVKETFEGYPDKIVFVWGNDKVYRSRFGSAFFLHRNWVDAVGYCVPPYFSSQYIDNWLNNVARLVNRRHYLPNVVIRHHNIMDDSTHKKYMRRSRRGQMRALFKSEEMVGKRLEDARRLQEFIERYQA